MKNLIRSAMVVAALAGGSSQAMADDAVKGPSYRDKEVNVTRAQHMERAARQFDRLDLNGDGILTADEFRQFENELRARKDGPRKERQRKLERAEEKRTPPPT